MVETFVIVNFKNYAEATLANCRKFIRTLTSVPAPPGFRISYSVSPVDLSVSGSENSAEILAQHVDPEGPGSSTGKVTIEALKEMGIMGSLLNHSENRISPNKIERTINKANNEGFNIILCVESASEARNFAHLKPSYIAYEPPELIGGEVSVSSARPDIITEVVRICEKYNVPVLVGAGVKNRMDLQKSLELGARGVLIASGIVRSSDPAGSLNSLISS